MQQYLVQHAAPTLAGMKTANLFTMPVSCPVLFRQSVAQTNVQLSSKGVTIIVLRQDAAQALVYVYRKKSLLKDWQASGAAAFLKQHGYEDLEIPCALKVLKSRCAGGAFPHEIGLFLGYPLEDVKGFICHGGKNCKCAGCWKVYGDECRARRLFAKYKKCREVYMRVFAQGTRSLEQMTLAV